MNVKEWLKITTKTKTIPGPNNRNFIITFVRPRVYCADGYNISIQANMYKYCCPRIDLDTGDYSEVELGYPSAIDEVIDMYAEGEASTDTVYGYVPVSVVDELLEKHGGIDENKTKVGMYEFVARSVVYKYFKDDSIDVVLDDRSRKLVEDKLSLTDALNEYYKLRNKEL